MAKIIDEVIAHPVGLVGVYVEVMLEIKARIPGGAPDTWCARSPRTAEH